MSKRIRLTALIISMFVFILCFTTAVFVFHQHSGACAGDDCPVCAAILLNKDTFGALSAFLMLTFISELYFEFKIFDIANREDIKSTPVLLKVKMIN